MTSPKENIIKPSIKEKSLASTENLPQAPNKIKILKIKTTLEEKKSIKLLEAVNANTSIENIGQTCNSIQENLSRLPSVQEFSNKDISESVMDEETLNSIKSGLDSKIEVQNLMYLQQSPRITKLKKMMGILNQGTFNPEDLYNKFKEFENKLNSMERYNKELKLKCVEFASLASKYNSTLNL